MVVTIEDLSKMSDKKFSEFKKTEDYQKFKEKHKDDEKFKNLENDRYLRSVKMEKLLTTLYKHPKETLNCLKEIQAYRTLRIKQAWNSMFKSESTYKQRNEALDRERKRVHNRSLANFYRLVSMSVDGSQSLLNARSEYTDFYAGKLAYCYDPNEWNKYPANEARGEMTDGMFDLLYYIQSTTPEQYEEYRENIKKYEHVSPKENDLSELIEKLNYEKSSKGFNMKEVPREDDFDPRDVFNDKGDYDR